MPTDTARTFPRGNSAFAASRVAFTTNKKEYVQKGADVHRFLFPGNYLRAHESSILKMDG